MLALLLLLCIDFDHIIRIHHAFHLHGDQDRQILAVFLLPLLRRQRHKPYSIHLLSKEKDECSFYIFSDDMVWTKENLKISGKPVYYVEHTTDATNYEDLYLMSICKHQIIANSSFSWWGAWLNEYSSKQIIAPKKWFADDSINTNDLIPAEWIRI